MDLIRVSREYYCSGSQRTGFSQLSHGLLYLGKERILTLVPSMAGGKGERDIAVKEPGVMGQEFSERITQGPGSANSNERRGS